MYVKKEALLSSQIEGTQASLENVFEYEKGLVPDSKDLEEVANYVKALNYGIKRLKDFPMSNRLIKELHAILLDATRGKEKTPGEFKRSQNWIGAPGSNLKNAFFVPPPPEESLQALSDLEKYMHEDAHYPELINCALIHYQFETIHPFLDGNGRIGRLLITLYLYWKNVIERPLLYLSYFFKQNRQEYYDRLTMIRNTGNYEQWVNFFLHGVIETSQSAIETTKAILALANADQKKLLDKKAPPASYALLQSLFYHPIVSIQEARTLLNVSYPTASNIISHFVTLGILKELGDKKKSRSFIYSAYIEILSEGASPLGF